MISAKFLDEMRPKMAALRKQLIDEGYVMHQILDYGAKEIWRKGAADETGVFKILVDWDQVVLMGLHLPEAKEAES